MNNTIDLIALLDHIDPSRLHYQEWVNVGMALKHEGYTANIWEDWSGSDPRHKPGECYTKWQSFRGEAGNLVTGGTIYQLAKNQGWRPEGSSKEDRALEWDDVISDEHIVVDTRWLEGEEVKEPDKWDPVQELKTYLGLLFESNEYVGYVTSTYETDDGKCLPKKGSYDRTAGELIELLDKCNGDLTNVFGTVRDDVGAWIRFNPLDGSGVKNTNVSEYRFALVESDSIEIEKQNAILRKLELPIAVLVYSGGKSLHAIVKIDAVNYDEYRKRVDYLYNICEKNGLEVDKQNRNPSRLSRMPGVMRNGKKQFIVDTNIGKKSWSEWEEWIEGVNDDLPDPEPLSGVWEDLPELAPPLIDGVLRQGHKMLLAGPSKAGKSFALIELCIAIAEGTAWLEWACTKGRVLYVNLELDRASALHRFKDVYKALNLNANNINNIDIWNLRGKSVPLDKLAPKLIRRSQKNNYIAVVIDPIYKVITGDENSASEMAHFTNQFDKIATELGCAVIYCHHHSKGYQGGKRSMDRASGSGVFARDPDALLDLTELEPSEQVLEREKQLARAKVIADYIQEYDPDYYEYLEPEDLVDAGKMTWHLKKVAFASKVEESMNLAIQEAERKVMTKTAWRIEGTLREYAAFEPVDLWFDYPIHTIDHLGILKDTQPESEKPFWQKGVDSQKTKKQRAEERANELEIAYTNLEMEGLEKITIQDLAEEMNLTEKTVDRRIRANSNFRKTKQEKVGDTVYVERAK